MERDLTTHPKTQRPQTTVHLILFFFSLLVIGCRKNIETSQQKSSIATSADGDYLGTYGATEPDMVKASQPTPDYIYGYTDKASYSPGDKMNVYLSAPPELTGNRSVSIKDVNGRVVQSFSCSLANQSISNIKPWVDGLGFKKTATISLNPQLPSGFYTIGDHVPFIIKGNPYTPHDITVVYPSNTANAYSLSGGKSLYGPGDFKDRSYVVSFLRYQGIDNYSMNFLHWLSKQSYSVNYIADSDLDNYENISRSKILVTIGHSEYWTRKARQNADQFVASGRNLLVLSGNTMYTQVRFNQPKDLMICYRNLDKNLDPLKNTPYATIFWSSPELNYPTISSIGAVFDNGGYGNRLPNRFNGYKIVNDRSPLLEGTGLKNGDILLNPTYEYDGAPLIHNVLPGSSEVPVIDNRQLKFYKVELIGFDFTKKPDNETGVATFIVFRKTPTSGTVVNVASEAWCNSIESANADQKHIQQITRNMIDKSLAGSNLFAK